VVSALLSLFVPASLLIASPAVARASTPASPPLPPMATASPSLPSVATTSPTLPPVPAGTSRVRPRIYPGGGLLNFGDAPLVEPSLPTPLNAPIVSAARVPSAAGQGMWFVGADGGVYAVGGAQFYGSTGALNLQGPMVAFAPTADGGGYFMAALDGGVFCFGDARFHGSMGGKPLNEPIVAMAVTPDDGGYWLVAADGGIFAFGDAPFYGSTGGKALPGSIVGMATTSDGAGYWLAGGDGSVYPFGDATFHDDASQVPLAAGIVGILPTADDGGYWLAAGDGGVFTFGDAQFLGSSATGPAVTPVTAIIGSGDGGGYSLLAPDAFAVDFANPPPRPTFPGAATVVAAAASQVQPDPNTGYFCNPYGPCEAWCALFATWAMERGGVAIPSYGFTGDVFSWGAARGLVLSPASLPAPGDAVLYGTGPANADTSVHMGIVAQVWPDGAIDTVEGDAGPGQAGSLAVVINGPFLASHSSTYNGFGIYAYVQG
jgi:hypothetical protein